MEQTIKTVLIVLLLVAVVALGSLLYIQDGLVHTQEQMIVELSSKIKSNDKQTNFDLQAKCADQARKEFDDNGWRARPMTSYSNHYNVRLNKCFIEIEDDDASIGTTKFIDDAFEGKTYANYFWRGQKGKKYWEVPPAICYVTTLGKEVECKSSDEFD